MNNEANQHDRVTAAMHAGAQAAGMPWEPPTVEEQVAIDRLATQLVALDTTRTYPQSESSAMIQPSVYGQALWQELLTRHRLEVQALAQYGVTKIPRAAQAWQDKPFDRDNPFDDPHEMLIVAADPSVIYPLTATYDVCIAVPDNTDCQIAITERCSGAATDELFVKHGQMLGYWHACTNCLSWLQAKARVEWESNDDLERKEKHFFEIDLSFGKQTRDLTRFMRSTDRLPFLNLD
jgi:hypothetical protein